MKLLIVVLFGVWTAATSSAQVTITRFERNGQLSWTNHLCTTRPVYELLTANSVTGAWQHVVFVTNQTTVVTTNPIISGTGSRFYKLQWVDDAPLILDYLFDEGFGCPAVSGQLTINFWGFPRAGTRVFDEDLCSFDGLHPLGTGEMTGLWYSASGLALFIRRDPDDFVWLEGILERSSTSSSCSYTRYSGTVFQGTIASSEVIGVFYAEPAR